MKKLITPILIACAMNVFAQNVNIPDAKFKATLISNGIDTNKDNEISFSEAEAVKSLNVSSKGISNLIGIEAFINLTFLYFSSNQLTSLDVTKNTKLSYLDFSSNQLTSLDISQNTELTTLICYSNKLTSLDVSQHTKLTKLDCRNNKLTSLDVTKNTKLIELNCNSNQLTSLDVSNTALKTLDCDYNKLTSLDVTKNTNLGGLYCSLNQLTSLDVTKNTNLIYLYCYDNKLTSLNVTKNTNLIYFKCYSNPNLKTICINSNYETSNWQKDATAEYSTTCETITSTESQTSRTVSVVKAYNLQGTEVPINTTGEMIILLYDNGTTQKVFQD